MSEYVFNSLSFLEDIFTGHKTLEWNWFSFSTFNISKIALHCLCVAQFLVSVLRNPCLLFSCMVYSTPLPSPPPPLFFSISSLSFIFNSLSMWSLDICVFLKFFVHFSPAAWCYLGLLDWCFLFVWFLDISSVKSWSLPVHIFLLPICFSPFDTPILCILDRPFDIVS